MLVYRQSKYLILKKYITVEIAPPDSGVFEVVDQYVEDLSCCFSPAMIPPSIVLDLYSRIYAVISTKKPINTRQEELNIF
jgi:hypothetical protein